MEQLLQFWINTEQRVHTLVLRLSVYFKTELLLQEEHNESSQLRQLVIDVQIAQVIYYTDYTNPYYFPKLHPKHSL